MRVSGASWPLPRPVRARLWSLVSGLWSLRMATRPLLQSRDAVTKATRGDTRALRDFFRETEPARAAGGERGPQRAASLGGLLGLFRSDKKAKDKEKEKERGERGSVRISTPPPGTVAITHNSGYARSFLLYIYVRVQPFSQAHRVHDRAAGCPVASASDGASQAGTRATTPPIATCGAGGIPRW